MSSEILLIGEKTGYAVLTLNNPPVNALSAETLTALDSALNKVRCEDAIKALLIVGSGEKYFTAGAEIKEFESSETCQANGTKG